MTLRLKLQYFGYLIWRADSLEKTDAGRDWGQEEKGTTEDEMARWHHWRDGREFEWTLGVGDGQVGLECCDSWGCKESDMTERLNWTDAHSFYSKWTEVLIHLKLSIISPRHSYSFPLINELLIISRITIFSHQISNNSSSLLSSWYPVVYFTEKYRE